MANGLPFRPFPARSLHISRATPQCLLDLIEDGVIDAVVQPLKSGKEADVFLVEREDATYIAKVFREREKRSFKNDAGYKEGRKSGNTRSQRAMDNNSSYGKKLNEMAWHGAEARALSELSEAGVRVPELFQHYDRVLFMELICDTSGHPAPQLGQVELTSEQALVVYGEVLAEVIRMLLAGYIHADLSPYNILMDDEGPVIIDFPQCVSAAHNKQAGKLLERDVASIAQHLGLINPEIRALGEEAWQIWEEYEKGRLNADFRPTPGRERALANPELPELVDYLRATKEEVELERLAADGDVEAWQELKALDRGRERQPSGVNEPREADASTPSDGVEELEGLEAAPRPTTPARERPSDSPSGKYDRRAAESPDPRRPSRPAKTRSRTTRGEDAQRNAETRARPLEDRTPRDEASTAERAGAPVGDGKKKRRRRRRSRRREGPDSSTGNASRDGDGTQHETAAAPIVRRDAAYRPQPPTGTAPKFGRREGPPSHRAKTDMIHGEARPRTDEPRSSEAQTKAAETDDNLPSYGSTRRRRGQRRRRRPGSPPQAS
jgi:RIO kinase 1